MKVKDLIQDLIHMDQNAQVHVEVFAGEEKANYGHALQVSKSEPNVVVISNRHRKPTEQEF